MNHVTAIRTLVVSSYPPRHCGIGTYASAQVARLRADGHRVTVLSPTDGRGDVRVPFFGGRPFLRAATLGRFDRIIVHFQPALYYRPRAPVSRVLTSLSLLWLVVRRPETEIVVHEADRPPSLLRPDYLLLRLAFARARLRFHTNTERRSLEASYRVRVRAAVVPHTEAVDVHGPRSREEARSRLGLPANEALFVCPGFLHPAKGFDRAVRAFARAGGRGRLVIVGSVRDPTPENMAHADRLRALVRATPGAELIDRYVSDQEFDAWVAAADWVVLPYRRSWSSGALARAARLGTPAIVAAVGGLPEQAGPGDVVFRDDDELARLLGEPARGRPARPAP